MATNGKLFIRIINLKLIIMTKKQFDKDFIEIIAYSLFEGYAKSGFLDKPMVLMLYNDSVDKLHRNNQITDHQVNNWCTPKKALNIEYLKKIRVNLEHSRL